MTGLLIVVDAADSPSAQQAIAALKRSATSAVAVEVKSIAAISSLIASGQLHLTDWLLCPLTLSLPADWQFSAHGLYQFCAHVASLRQQVKARWQVPTGDGNYWLPIVYTAKGPLYAEAIASALPTPSASASQNYQQPFHLNDAQRQPLYQLAQNLLQHLAAPPAVYLMQFGLTPSGLVFDRLWPFPATPAIASIGVQTPDLFACHWACLNHLPILDLTIRPTVQSAASPTAII